MIKFWTNYGFHELPYLDSNVSDSVYILKEDDNLNLQMHERLHTIHLTPLAVSSSTQLNLTKFSLLN
jgi:hypothetical protein